MPRSAGLASSASLLARTTIAIALATGGGTWASAQEAIPTAGGSGAPPALPAPEAAPLALGDRPAFDDRGPAPVSPCAMFGLGPAPDSDTASAPQPPAASGAAASRAAEPPPVDRGVHGEVFAGVGTGGYREGGLAACAPLGRNAAVAVSIDAARFGR